TCGIASVRRPRPRRGSRLRHCKHLYGLCPVGIRSATRPLRALHGPTVRDEVALVRRPATAEGTVQRHLILDQGRAYLHDGLLRGEQRTLRIEYVEIAGSAAAIAQIGQLEAPLLGAHLPLLREQLPAQRR